MRHLKKMISNKTNHFRYLILYLLLFFINQVRLILRGGTTWDDLKLLETTPRIIEKFFLFFIDSTNPFLSEFSSNFEFYGFLVLVPAYLFSNSVVTLKVFDFIFNDLFSYNLYRADEIEYYLRHIFLNIYLVVTLIFSYYLYGKISGKQKAFQFILILTLIPSFNGQALFNLKDIPYMMQTVIAILYALMLFKNFDRVTKKSELILGILFGLLLLVRLNGVVFIFITAFFSIFIIDLKKYKIIRFLFFWIRVFLTSVVTLFLGTPSLWQKPKLWLTESIKTQFNIYWDSYVLTNGSFSFAMEIDPFYLIKWFYYKLPLIFHLFTLVFIYLLIKKKIYRDSRKNLLLSFSIYLILFINIGFMVTTPVAYDGIRQYLFLLPFLAIFFVETLNILRFKEIQKEVFFACSVLYLIFTQFGLEQYKYIYFNEIVDEFEITIDCEKVGGCGNWQTDYWGFSGKSLIENVNSMEIKNELYLCTPEHVFSTYLESEISKNISALSPTNEEFYIAYLHRPMLINDTCGLNKSNIKLSCESFLTESTKLRSVSVDLSYIDKCKKG